MRRASGLYLGGDISLNEMVFMEGIVLGISRGGHLNE